MLLAGNNFLRINVIAETRLAVLDRSQIFCEGLKGILDQRQDIQVVRIYIQLNEALRELDKQLYDVLIISTNLIECSVSEAITKVHKFLPQLNIMVIYDSGTLDECTRAVKAGAVACITRDISLKSFVRIIELVADGNVVVPSIVADRLLDKLKFMERVRGTKFLERVKDTTRIGDIDIVTKREGAVLNLVAQGLKNREIAATLSISEQTAKVHLRNIMSKLNAHNRSQAVALVRARSGQGPVKRRQKELVE